MTMVSSSSSSNNVGQFGDTALTKVFVGGLPWETPKGTLREHFEKFGEILEAVIISDKLTGRSKGYGFVTFKEAEAAKKACEEASVIINGRRANCNLASIGARRPFPKSSFTNSPPPAGPPPPKGSNGGALRNGGQVQWYYPVTPAPAPPSPFHPHSLPFYGYTPTYIASDINYCCNYNYNYNYNYNQKPSYGSGGAYMNGQMAPVYPRAAIVDANTLMPMYPVYHYFHRPAHIFHPTLPAHFATVPPSITPDTGTVGTDECFKRVA